MTFLNGLKVYEFSFISKEKNLSLVFFLSKEGLKYMNFHVSLHMILDDHVSDLELIKFKFKL